MSIKSFNSVRNVKTHRSLMNLNKELRFDADMFNLYPTLVMDCIPGDSIDLSAEVVVRMNPLAVPIMHRIDWYFHAYAVPYRILDPKFENYIFGQPDETTPEGSQFPDNVPRSRISTPINGNNVGIGGYTRAGSLLDFLYNWENEVSNAFSPNNLPIGPLVNYFPLGAYYKIWDEQYRDKNVIPYSTQYGRLPYNAQGISNQIPMAANITGVPSGSQLLGNVPPEVVTSKGLLRRALKKDYFTAALPWQQRGASNAIPFSGLIKLVADPAVANADNYQPVQVGSMPAGNGYLLSPTPSQQNNLLVNAFNKMYVDLTRKPDGTPSAGVFNVNDLREMWQIQMFKEGLATGGVRYTETLRKIFNVAPRDERLQRPEYIGGAKGSMIISEVLQTSASVASGSTQNLQTPQGNMSGHGISAGGSHLGRYFCKEHCVIMVLLSFLPQTLYPQGINRQWLRSSRYEFFLPYFENWSEQAIKISEIFPYFSNTTDPNQEKYFAYINRYDEYRFQKSEVHGLFRTTYARWHMGRTFTSMPLYNSGFIYPSETEVNNIWKRGMAVPSESMFMCAVAHRVSASRPMVLIAEPGRVDHVGRSL